MSKINRNIYLEIDCPTFDFPIAKTRRIGAAATAKLLRHFRLSNCLAAFLGFPQGTLCCRRQRLVCKVRLDHGFGIVVIGSLHSRHRMVH